MLYFGICYHQFVRHRDEYLVFHVKVRKVCWCRKLFFREIGEIILNIF